MNATVSDTLNQAADLIEQHGWGRASKAMSGNNGVCVMGALFAARQGRFLTEDECHDDSASYSIVSADPAYAAMLAYTQSPRPLYLWNDAQEDGVVVEALRACAVIEAARERESVAVSA